jgi:hypothetical protein
MVRFADSDLTELDPHAFASTMISESEFIPFGFNPPKLASAWPRQDHGEVAMAPEREGLERATWPARGLIEWPGACSGDLYCPKYGRNQTRNDPPNLDRR